MHRAKPRVAALGEIRISREGEDAIIEYLDGSIAVTHFRLGPEVHELSDQEILDQFNEVIAECESSDGAEQVAIEVPPEQPQITFFEPGQQWVPRGQVLRCIVEDSGPDNEAVIYIDDQALSLSAFGRLLCTYAGWGMRIAFVPEDRIEEQPCIEVREPEADEGD
ncbi:MAG: DUF7713 domain-containing protein [Candidatus Binatia bacterium]